MRGCAESYRAFLLIEARPDLSVDLVSFGEELDVACGDNCPQVQIGSGGKPGVVFDGYSTLITVHLPPYSQTMPMDSWKGFTAVIKASFMDTSPGINSVLAITENGAMELRQEGNSLHVILRDAAATVLDATASFVVTAGQPNVWTITCAPGSSRTPNHGHVQPHSSATFLWQMDMKLVQCFCVIHFLNSSWNDRLLCSVACDCVCCSDKSC